MIEEYDKNVFAIEDLYDLYLAQYEEYCKDYENKYEYWDSDEEGYELETPEEYKRRVFGDLKRGDQYILVKYNGSAEEVEIPIGVTGIRSFAFANNAILRSVYIPDSVVNVGANVFDGCKALENVRLSENQRVISKEQFRRCSALRSIKVPDSVETLGANCFDGCAALQDVSLGKNIKSIGWDAFSRCKSLKNISLPESLEEIEQSVFYDSGLEEIYIPKNVKYIGSGAFTGCSKLNKIQVDPQNTNLYSRDNCIYDTENKWLLVGRNDGTLPNDGSIVGIYGDAFAGNQNIVELNIPNGVTAIGYSAFKDCVNLKRLTLPVTLEVIHRCAFEGCTSLEEVVIPGKVKEIEGLSFYKSGLKRVVIKRGVEVIDGDAFDNCNNLQEVYIPSTVRKIYSPLGSRGKVNIYVELGEEKNCEKWIDRFKGYNVTLGCDSKVFD